MLNQFLKFIKKHALIYEEEKLLLAVSGGVDSMVLMHLCHQAGFNCTVAHCNFQLRGSESEEDEAFVEKTCNALDIPFITKIFDTKNFAKAKGVSTQMAARELRYQWFEELLGTYGLDKLVVAHHGQDNLETVLLNLIRGTSISGLRGMLPQNGAIVRPLLFTQREEIEAYAQTHAIKWREDSSNPSDDYKRNYLRHNVIPLLTKLNPGFYSTFENTLEKNLEVEHVFYSKIDELKKFIEPWEEGERLAKSTIVEKNVGPFQLCELLRPYGFNFEQAKELIHALNGISGKVFLSSTHSMVIDRDYVFITSIHKEKIVPFQLTPENQRFKMGEKQYELERTTDILFSNLPENAFLDYGKLSFPLEVRGWNAGDYFFPLGMKGKKKVSDFMIDQKIPLNLKQQVRVITSKGEIVWVVGWRIDDRYKIDKNTREVLRIQRIRNDV